MEHVFREGNKCADALTKRGCSMPEDFVVFDLLPNCDISSLVNMDASSLYYCRLSGATLATLAS